MQALQSVGQIVGEVLRQLTEEKFIVKVSTNITASSWTQYMVCTGTTVPTVGSKELPCFRLLMSEKAPVECVRDLIAELDNTR